MASALGWLQLYSGGSTPQEFQGLLWAQHKCLGYSQHQLGTGDMAIPQLQTLGWLHSVLQPADLCSLWLTATQVGGPVGVQALNQSGSDWYSRSQAYGMGRRECRNVEPQLQVSSQNCAGLGASVHPNIEPVHMETCVDEYPQPTTGACRSAIGADARIWQSAVRKPRWWRDWLLRACWSQTPCHRAWQQLETDNVWKGAACAHLNHLWDVVCCRM